MLKTKILMVIAAAISALIVSTSSAVAFKSSTETGKAAAPAESTLTVSPGNSAVKCTNSGAEVEWKIAGGSSLTEGLNVKKWGTCSAKVSGTFLTAEVKPCELSVTQAAQGAVTGTGGVVTTCEVKVSKCVIVVSSASNSGLERVSLEESGANDKIVPKVKGVTTEFGSSMTEEEKTKCKEKGFVLGKEGTYGVGTTAPAFLLAEGQKL